MTSLRIAAAFIAVSSIHWTAALAQTTAGEFWPEIDAHVQLPKDYRLVGFAGLKHGEDFPFQQLHVGLELGHQWKRMTKRHLQNIDADKERIFVFGTGYEYLRTLQSGNLSQENRLTPQVIFSVRPLSPLLVQDRNRVECRWVNGEYSTRYRNRLSLEYDLTAHRLRFTPYASAEVFYDSAKNSWNEEQYAGGIQVPFKRLLAAQIYYLRQNCTTCTPPHLNVAGLTLNFHFRNEK